MCIVYTHCTQLYTVHACVIMCECMDWMPILFIHNFNCDCESAVSTLDGKASTEKQNVKWMLQNSWKLSFKCSVSERERELYAALYIFCDWWWKKLKMKNEFISESLDSIALCFCSSISCHFPGKQHVSHLATHTHTKIQLCNKHQSFISYHIYTMCMSSCVQWQKMKIKIS